MNNSSRNRNHPDHKLEQQILKTDLCHTLITEIQQLVVAFAADFDLDFLPQRRHKQPTNGMDLADAIAELYSKTKLMYQKSCIEFDNHWVNLYNLTISILILTFSCYRIGLYLGGKLSASKAYLN
jgi:hypothetical protein